MKTPAPQPILLGIEGGGTRTVVLLANAQDRLLQRLELGPANLRLLSDAQLLKHFRVIRRALPVPSVICIGLAGVRSEDDRARIRKVAAALWPGVPCHATNDLETALAAAGPVSRSESPAVARVLVLSGTGSCFFGQTADGLSAKLGGWGHLLGDKGSGFEIGLRALKAVVFYFDRDGEWSRLGRSILRALALNDPEDLIPWVQGASKGDIASLAPEVFKAAAAGDLIARDILEGAAGSLARDAVSCARKLQGAAGGKLPARVEFVFAGSALLRQPEFAAKVAKQIGRLWAGAVVSPLTRESAWGAVALARQKLGASDSIPKPTVRESTVPRPALRLPRSTALSPTEQRNPRSMNLDKLPLGAAVGLMLREDGKVPVAVLSERRAIERALRLIVRAFKAGGRLFYVGAGTSGRLGVLDASECPPTFHADPEMVQGIIAGGAHAITNAVEGAEDDFDAGGRAVEFRGVGPRDVVVGIAASGRTPFVWGALTAAQRRGAATVFLCFNPHLEFPRELRPNVVIAPDLGPEILTGSTRLKSGTATKLILNIFTTLAMVRCGKVLGNLMVDLKPSNVKLRDRAARIVSELTGADYERSRSALEQSGWAVRRAVVKLGRRK